jgi:hypothetical protein
MGTAAPQYQMHKLFKIRSLTSTVVTKVLHIDVLELFSSCVNCKLGMFA